MIIRIDIYTAASFPTSRSLVSLSLAGQKQMELEFEVFKFQYLQLSQLD
jgi:hypothetical protein